MIVLREQWLNGWSRLNGSVLIGSAAHCAGCGKFHGTTCVVFDNDWAPPEKLPEWPFNEDECPLYKRRDIKEFVIEEIAGLGISILRKAMIMAKTKGTLK